MELNVAIVGCGLIGQKRARALGEAKLVACADVVIERAQALAQTSLQTQPLATSDWREVVKRNDVDVVIVSTINNALAEITLESVRAGKHVLVEKPAARRAAELDLVSASAKAANVHVRVGFNHRYHPAFQKADEIRRSGALGELMFVRGRYGHGGRLGYEKEWRADPILSGGGELLDQGVHLIDLARWFLGDFVSVQGFAHTYYWQMPVDDNGFMLLRTSQQQTAFLHASCTEWKNLFSFEIYGKHAKLHIEGLGGSYGVERLAYYQMSPEMGPPQTTIWEYPMGDRSWELEFAEFVSDIQQQREPQPNLHDAQAALRIVERIYQQS